MPIKLLFRADYQPLKKQESRTDVLGGPRTEPVLKDVRFSINHLSAAKGNGRMVKGRVTMADPGSMPVCASTHTAANPVKSANRYQHHIIVRRTTRAYNGIIVTKRLLIMCPSANIIGIKDNLILRTNDSGIYFRI